MTAELYKRLWLTVEAKRAAAEREITESAETLARFADAPHDIAVGVCLKRIAKAKQERDEAAALLDDLEKIAPEGC